MKSIFALVRNLVLVAALVSSFVIIPTAQAASSNARNNDAFIPKAYQRSDARSEGTYPFEFHSGFWINLHHFLYEQALLRKEAASSGQTANSAANPNSQLSAEQRQLWNTALDFYTNTLIKRDLLDRDMAIMNDQLSEAEGAADLSRSNLSGDLIKILESVAPLYRARWWPQHDRTNRFWITVATPLVQQFGQTLINQLTAAYKAKWPTDLIRVDITEYANWAGGYTTVDPEHRVHTTMSSTAQGYQGFDALEMLFHEASHSMVWPRNGAVAEAIARESRAKNRPIPGGLWHAIIFYTAGEFTKRDLNEYGVSDYKPVAYRGLYARAWPDFQRPLELYWQPYLEGKVDFDKAISNLINAL